ncbi:hypothetical protein BHE74_00008447 [Ensete ventricosum]|nr:hypothetical protein BHE74_00008447 [Ensete ventricosum]RZR96532.1 hypothetical protein BHM03_00025569 [Ensete ventricosum]
MLFVTCISQKRKSLPSKNPKHSELVFKLPSSPQEKNRTKGKRDGSVLTGDWDEGSAGIGYEASGDLWRRRRPPNILLGKGWASLRDVRHRRCNGGGPALDLERPSTMAHRSRVPHDRDMTASRGVLEPSIDPIRPIRSGYNKAEVKIRIRYPKR